MTRVLFVILARGGSRRIPAKNVRPVAGIPLVGQCARLARAAARGLPGGPHVVACSTDDATIAGIARDWGADTIVDRPPHLATDLTTSADATLHTIEVLDRPDDPFTAAVLLQPTSPLTSADDLRAGILRFLAASPHSAVSVTASHPTFWHHDMAADGILVRPNAAPPARHLLAGAFYVVDPVSFRQDPRFVISGRTIGIPVPAERSIDIDEPIDIPVAEALAAARPVREVRFGDRSIGDGSVFVIAEAGVNHDGDVERARGLIDAAAESGADAVKFQTFEPGGVVSPGAPTAAYQRTAGEGESQHAMLARLMLPVDAWPVLQAHAHHRGLVFLSTPFDLPSARLLDRLGVPAFKIGSGELTNIPFLRAVAGHGRPMLLSTGMAEMREVAMALDALSEAGDPPVALFHCVSAYPARTEDANLRAIPTLRAAFGVPVGWSDHTTSVELPTVAVALGAALIEKHLTLDRAGSGPDHRASLEPEGFAAMVRGIRAAVASLGDGEKRPVEAERPVARVARRSLHWARALPPGALVAAEDLAALRPEIGLPPVALDVLVGARTVRAVAPGTEVTLEDVEPDERVRTGLARLGPMDVGVAPSPEVGPTPAVAPIPRP